MTRPSFTLLCLALGLAPLQGATLERLTLDDLIAKSTAVVRGRVAGSAGTLHGNVIYTSYKIQVIERLKGPAQATLEVLVPGGTFAGRHQIYSGAPKLVEGKEYVLFLWTGKRGTTFITGYTQGLFETVQLSSGETIAFRGATAETVLDPATWQVVKDQAWQMRLSDLESRVSHVLAGSAKE